ncbi:hypothetical protein KUTeg_006335 [Tegillarca granosa]|uniref:Ig-like domain-containing protein n=1 Tax=Tegillarca granosa TaxID=220873 RepID=A0ABQ9FI42_TEGGR|nr:hypothetical protein KUTeg_006335 [Tegillarca granosa]
MTPLNVTSEVSVLIGQPVNITCSVALNWHSLSIDISNNEKVAFYSKTDNNCKNYAENSQNLTHICDLTQRRFGIGFQSIRWERNNSKVKFTLTYNEDTEHQEINKSSRIVIEPIDVILITNQTTVEENELMSFQCEVKGVKFAVTTVKWFKDSVPFTNYDAENRFVRDKMISKIKIYPGLLDNGAIFNCATNISGKTLKSNKQTITVGRGPVNVCIYPDLLPYVVASNGNHSEIFCHSNCTPPCTYKWFSMSTASVIGHNSTFPHQRSINNQIEKYYCLAQNPRTGKEKITSLNIYNIKYGEDIYITKSRLYNISENTSFILPCLQPDIMLLHKNDVKNKKVNKKDIKKYSNIEDTATVIFNASCFDAGLYTCKSTTCQGNITHQKFNVSVLCHPYFVSKITFIEREVVIGKPIVFTVRYTGYPPPILMLKKKQIPASDIRKRSSFGFLIRDNTQGMIHNVRIYKHNAELGDNGKYSVEVSNYIGKTKVDIFIKVITTTLFLKETVIISIVAASVLFCIVMVLIGRFVKRRRSYNGNYKQIVEKSDFFADNQACSEAIHYVNAELRAIEPYENLSITEDNTSYEEAIQKEGLQTTDISSERRQYEESFTDTNSTENAESDIIVNAPEVGIENALDFEDVE